MTKPPDRFRWREAFRRYDRVLMWGYLGAVGLGIAVLTLPPLRSHLLWGAQRVITAWDERWSRRLELGEALVRAGKYPEAVTYLERLDRSFPARDVRHARDKERERLLLALGRSYLELDRKQRAIETYQRLVLFDPRNYRNYYALAVASNRLLAGWAPALEARDAFLQVLRINPSHLPSVRGAIAYHSARGEFAEVVQLYQGYLDAYLRHELTVSLGDSTIALDVAADGEFHEYAVRVTRPAGWSGPFRIEAGGFALELERALLLPPQLVGVARPQAEVALPLARTPPADKLLLPIPPQREGLVEVRLTLRLFKPMDPTTWQMVVTAYRNRLDEAGLAAARTRTLLLLSAAAADSILLLPAWAAAGSGIGADATPW